MEEAVHIDADLLVVAVDAGPGGGFASQPRAAHAGQQTLFRALDLPEPPRIFDYTLPSSS